MSKTGQSGILSEALRLFGRQALFGLALITLAAAVVAGCAQPPPPTPKIAAAPPPSPPPPPAPKRPRPVRLPVHKPAPPPEPGGPPPEAEAIASTVPEPPQNSALPAYPMQSRALVGLDQKAAVALFGNAQEKSEKPPATVWRWRSGTCELDLYFYLDLRSGQMRSLHYVFKGDATGQQDCLKSLAVAARG